MTNRTQPETLHEVGEFSLIDRIASLVGSGEAVVGIGDDAAVLDQPGDEYLLATVDMLVEDVHFRFGGAEEAIGRRAMGVNISDIAAMGGTPRYALVSLALPPSMDVNRAEAIIRGLSAEGRQFGVQVVGGNVTGTSGPAIVDIALLGSVPKGAVLLRSTARPGDVLAVTGSLGERAAARLAYEAGLPPFQAVDNWPDLAMPSPRVSQGKLIAGSGLANAMMDLSDGLGSDLQRLAKASSVGAVLYSESLPISDLTRSVAAALHRSAVDLALYGGEDYELLVALPMAAVAHLQQHLGGYQLHVIGTVLPEAEGIAVERDDGVRHVIGDGSWRHF